MLLILTVENKSVKDLVWLMIRMQILEKQEGLDWNYLAPLV